MKKEPLLSFHGKQEIKDKYIARVKAHAAADEIVKGVYWEYGKGCAVGCTVHSNQHDAYEDELGISWRMAIMEDGIFEKLPNDEAKKFPLQFLEAIPVGIDTDRIFKELIIWALVDEKDGAVHAFTKKEDQEYKAVLQEVAETYKLSFKQEIPQSTWASLAKRASASASASAYASAYAYASASAYAYAYASAYASDYASAYAYASASAYASDYASASPEWKKEFEKRIMMLRDKLIELLSNAK